MDRSTVNKLQHQYWVTKQTVYRKLGKKEDECIISSDSELDAKLELFKSIQQSSFAMNKLLDRYQERICYLAQEQNAMGRFLKEHGKADKSAAGKMMIQMGKSLIYSSQQEIGLRPPLLRLYQEVETFRNRAVDDTHGTIHQMEKVRTEYRASLNWMKKVSQELDPDTNRQMEKFRKVQNHVKSSKSQFDKLKLACLQKVDLLAAARCNMFSHALIQYIQAMTKITSKNAKIFNTLAITFKGHQHFEFSVVKELAEPSKKLADECGSKPQSDQLLFDFNDDLNCKAEKENGEKPNISSTEQGGGDADLISQGVAEPSTVKSHEQELLSLADASQLLENLLGPIDQSPETEQAQDALDLGLGLETDKSPDKDKDPNTSNSLINIGSFRSKKDVKKDKDKSKDVMDLLSADEFEGLSFESESCDTMTLLNEILSASNPQSGGPSSQSASLPSLDSSASKNAELLNSQLTSSSFMPSQLLDLGSLRLDDTDRDLLNLSGPSMKSAPPPTPKADSSATGAKSWYDIFADLDPLGNPDSIGDKEKDSKDAENRYC